MVTPENRLGRQENREGYKLPRRFILGDPQTPEDYWCKPAVLLRRINRVSDADMLEMWGLPEDFKILQFTRQK